MMEKKESCPKEKPQSVLDGVVVLDLASLITGPFCATLLADLGATVIKLEHPQGGELLRHLGIMTEGESSLFLAVNRNKKGATLNFDLPEGLEILHRAIAQADVVVENYRPDIKKKYGLTYENLSRIKPNIIHLSITGFGEEGPYRLKPGTDHVFQGLSGMMSVSGENGQGPLRIGVPVADMTASLCATIGVMSALLHRERSGRGQQVCINLLDAAMLMQTTLIGDYFFSGEKPVPCGNDSPFSYPVGVFRTADHYIAISAFTNKFWKRLCSALELPALAADPRFDSEQKRLEQRAELKPILSKAFMNRKTGQWLSTLEELDVPCGPVHDYDSLFLDPQVVHNGLTRSLPHACLKSVKTVGNPIRLGGTPVNEKKSAPVLGEDTEEVMRLLKVTGKEMGELKKKRVI